MKQLDVSSAFLHGDLDTTIYVRPPMGFERGNLIWKLQKALYGLKQSPRLWYKKLHDCLVTKHYQCSIADPGLYFKNVDNKSMIFIAVWVDDLKIFYNDQLFYSDLLSILSSQFKMKEISSNQFIGIEISQDPITLAVTIHQKSYISRVLERFKVDSKSSTTPLTKNLSPNTDPINEHIKLLFGQIVGVIIHLSRVTRPDLAYVASHFGSFLHNPSQSHLDAAINCLRYIRHTFDYHIQYHGDSYLIGYADANYKNGGENGFSVGGYLFLSNNGAISWSAKKQKRVALSSAESEYFSLSEAAKEAIFLKHLAQSINILISNSIPVYVDNTAAISLSKNPIKHSSMKHIPNSVHFVRQLVEEKEIDVKYIESTKQLADYLTKPLSQRRLKLCCQNSGIKGYASCML